MDPQLGAQHLKAPVDLLQDDVRLERRSRIALHDADSELVRHIPGTEHQRMVREEG